MSEKTLEHILGLKRICHSTRSQVIRMHSREQLTYHFVLTVNQNHLEPFYKYKCLVLQQRFSFSGSGVFDCSYVPNPGGSNEQHGLRTTELKTPHWEEGKMEQPLIGEEFLIGMMKMS